MPTDVLFRLSEPLGMNIDPDNLDVVSVVPGAQAQRSGVAPGSRIVAVDGEPVSTYDELMARRDRAKRYGRTSVSLSFTNLAGDGRTACHLRCAHGRSHRPRRA